MLNYHHVEIPIKIAVAGWAAFSSLATIAWQLAGHVFSIVTPDQISKMDERTVYISAIVVLGAAFGWLGKWVLYKLSSKIDESNMAQHAVALAIHASAQSQQKVAESVNALTSRVDGIMIETVTSALHASFPPSSNQTATLGSPPSPGRKKP